VYYLKGDEDTIQDNQVQFGCVTLDFVIESFGSSINQKLELFKPDQFLDAPVKFFDFIFDTFTPITVVQQLVQN
jgi:hypothetical protein